MPNRLILFTRYPLPGTAKTRLIPALGAVGAANLQRQMTQHTLSQVTALRSMADISVEIWFAGTAANESIDRQNMQDWLGSSWVYHSQGTGDLGERLIRATQQAFEQEMQRVVVIGTDCPELRTDLLQQAFEALQSSDVVLGPAVDGGYYLIGLRQFAPYLFQRIHWSNDVVLQQTVERAQAKKLTIAYLEQLTDIDRPEDLQVWQSLQGGRFELE